MTVAAIVLAAGEGSRFDGPDHKLRAEVLGTPILLMSVNSATAAGFDEVIVVVGSDSFSDLLPESVSVVECEHWKDGQASSLQAGIDHAQAKGHEAVVVGLADQPLVGERTWRALAASEASTPIVASTYAGRQRPPTRLDAAVWDRLPRSSDAGARILMTEHPELVTTIGSSGDPSDVDTKEALGRVRQRAVDIAAVTELLGRQPMGQFEVVVRDPGGGPVVLRNHPVLADGRPMPTLYWLCGERESMLVGRLESMKGVRRAEAEVGLEAIAAAHERYRCERDVILEASGEDPTHRPTGGVGGTRVGVKCLHAHYGWWLAGGDDPVGQWVADHLHEVDHSSWPRPVTMEDS